MPSLVVIGQQIKEKRRGGGGAQCSPSPYNNKIPWPEQGITVVQAKLQNVTVSQHILLQ